MAMIELLSPERVTTQLQALDKASALRSLATLLAGDQQEQAGLILRVMEERESLASTGVGSGVAIPHGRLDGCGPLRAAFAISSDGIAFDSVDGQPAHIFVAIFGPTRPPGDHLRALAAFSKVLRKPAVRRMLLEADDCQSVLAALEHQPV